MTETAGEPWRDVDQRLRAQETADYAAAQQEAADAEAEHRRLTKAAVLGDAVEPLALQAVESRKQLTDLRVTGLREKHRLARDEAARQHVPFVRARAEALIGAHKGASSAVEAARANLVRAARELLETVDAYNEDVRALLGEVAPAFTVSTRSEALVEMVPFRNETTQQVEYRPVVKQAPGPIGARPVTGEVDGMRVTWAGVVDGQGGTPQALTVDGTKLEPVDRDAVLLTGLEDHLPAAVRTEALKITRPFGVAYASTSTAIKRYLEV